jgi:hypothetical protein
METDIKAENLTLDWANLLVGHLLSYFCHRGMGSTWPDVVSA